MTRDGQQRRKQDLARYLGNMAEVLGRLPLWADGEELGRLRQLRLSTSVNGPTPVMQQLSPLLKPDRKEQTDESLASL